MIEQKNFHESETRFRMGAVTALAKEPQRPSIEKSNPPVAPAQTAGLSNAPIYDADLRSFQTSSEHRPENLSDEDLLAQLFDTASSTTDPAYLASSLIRSFGSLKNVLSAKKDQIYSIKYMTNESGIQLQILKDLLYRFSKSGIYGIKNKYPYPEIMHHCRSMLVHREMECLHVFYLNTNSFVISDEEAARGTVDHIHFYPREILKRALELNAVGILMVHNHPSDDPTPTLNDGLFTKKICDGGRALGVELYDHVILSQTGSYSFQMHGDI